MRDKIAPIRSKAMDGSLPADARNRTCDYLAFKNAFLKLEIL